MTLFTRPGPRWFNIPAHRPFVQDLAAGRISVDEAQSMLERQRGG